MLLVRVGEHGRFLSPTVVAIGWKVVYVIGVL